MPKSIGSIASISLISMLLLSVTVLPVKVYAFETDNTGFVKNGIAQGIGIIADPVHQDITHSAFDAFMKSAVVNDINHGHEESDFISANQLNSAFHFDGCDFLGSTNHINELYKKISAEDLTKPQARIDFGQILHTVQDFYSHSNWIELQNAGFIPKSIIVDAGLADWNILHSNDRISIPGTKVVVIENPILQPLSRPDNGHIVFKTSEADTVGLISGIAFDNGKCPSDIALGHYDPIFIRGTDKVVDKGRFPVDKLPDAAKPAISPFGNLLLENRGGVTGLNKDNPSRIGLSFGPTSSSGFPDARDGALKQTIHEWCRLVNLVNGKDGVAGLKLLFDSWALGAGNAVKPCLSEIPSLKDIVSSPPFVISSLLPGKSAEPPSLTPPPTGELPGLICGDGSVPTLTGCADGSLPSLGKSGETPPGETPPGETPPVGLPGLFCGDGSVPTLTGCADGSLPSLGKSGETPPGETPPGETPPVGLPGLFCGDGSVPTLTGCADGSLPSLGKSSETSDSTLETLAEPTSPDVSSNKSFIDGTPDTELPTATEPVF